jgi:hypothetical protein
MKVTYTQVPVSTYAKFQISRFHSFLVRALTQKPPGILFYLLHITQNAFTISQRVCNKAGIT